MTYELAAAIARLGAERDRVAVAVDGPDAAGKSTLADRLARVVPATTVRASIDGFQQPEATRWRRGRLSPEGYYRDAFDTGALRRELVDPFLRGAAVVRTATTDHGGDGRPMTAVVPRRAVLIVDGVFLLRPELREVWTLAVYLHVPPAETLRRAVERDRERMGSREEVELRYRRRYLPGQELYRAEARPAAFAHIVIDNLDPPRIRRWSASGAA